jgi:1-acyl-sn-glycerol-3-phosphate acyltransferase
MPRDEAERSTPPPTPRRPPHERSMLWKTLQVPVRLAATLVFELQAFHPGRVPPTGGVLMVSNHQSYLDPPLLGTKLNRSMAYLAKSELFEHGPFARLIRALNAFPIRQGKGDVGAMKESIRLLQEGWLLNVFPEGSRTPDGRVHPAQKGAGLLIRRAGVPVVPVAIDGSYEAWPRGDKLPHPHPIRILYGHPVSLAHRSADDIRKWIDDTLPRMFDDLRAGRV